MLIENTVNKIDIYTSYMAFWKSLVLRNTQESDSVTYRTDPNSSYKTLQPNSEIPIKGWGSYFEVVNNSVLKVGLVEFECVNIKEAMRDKNA